MDSLKNKPEIELTDDQLMEMTGGSSYVEADKKISIGPIAVKYGIKPVLFYGIMPLYGIIPVPFSNDVQ